MKHTNTLFIHFRMFLNWQQKYQLERRNIIFLFHLGRFLWHL